MHTNTHRSQSSTLYVCWNLSLVAFVIAAIAGVVFRLGMLDGFALGFAPGHLRHAHSHLMLMGWTTPALMTLMAASWPRQGARPLSGAVVTTILISWLLAMGTFQPFLYHGYGRVDIAGRALPLAAILSGLAMFGWYAFAIVYALATRGVRRTTALRLWDAATIFLVISSLGAWGVGALMIKGVESAFWSSLMLHFFVDLFGEGWLILGALGLMHAAYDTLDARREGVARKATILLVIGMPTLFILGMPSNLVPTPMAILTSLGAFIVGVGLVLHLRTLRLWAPGSWARGAVSNHDDGWLWKLLWLLLAIKTIALFIAAVPPLMDWARALGLRLFYLHLNFLGISTLGLVAAARYVWSQRAFTVPAPFAASVLMMLASLLALTGLLPSAFAGRWPFVLAMILSIPPTALAAYALIRR
jgi:hypothetical protein